MTTHTRRSPGLSPRAPQKSFTTTTYTTEATATSAECGDCSAGVGWAVRWVITAGDVIHTVPVADGREALALAGWLAVHGRSNVELHVPNGAAR